MSAELAHQRERCQELQGQVEELQEELEDMQSQVGHICGCDKTQILLMLQAAICLSRRSGLLEHIQSQMVTCILQLADNEKSQLRFT